MAEQHAPEWQAAAEVLVLIGEHGGDPMMAHLAMMRALHRHKPKPTPAPRGGGPRAYRIAQEAPLRCPGCGARLPFGPGKRMLSNCRNNGEHREQNRSRQSPPQPRRRNQP